MIQIIQIQKKFIFIASGADGTFLSTPYEFLYRGVKR